MERLTLVLPDPAWERQAEDYRQAYLDSGECHINGSSAMERYPVYSEWLDRINALQKLPVSQEHTPATTFFAVREQDGRIVGTIQIRHRLTGELCRSGGNIGYGVRPDERKKGDADAGTGFLPQNRFGTGIAGLPGRQRRFRAHDPKMWRNLCGRSASAGRRWPAGTDSAVLDCAMK